VLFVFLAVKWARLFWDFKFGFFQIFFKRGGGIYDTR